MGNDRAAEPPRFSVAAARATGVGPTPATGPNFAQRFVWKQQGRGRARRMQRRLGKRTGWVYKFSDDAIGAGQDG
jgi:hypothetical protein